jgi:carbamoylphosphate synthase small subunit
LLDLGVKENMIRCLVKRDAKVSIVPWNYDIALDPARLNPDGLFLSNGPGNPTLVTESYQHVKAFMTQEAQKPNPIPIFGICMGNQILGMAAGFKVYKLLYGNRGRMTFN